MLSKKYRLTDSREFKLVFKRGVKIRGKYGMLIVLAGDKKVLGKAQAATSLSGNLHENEILVNDLIEDVRPPRFGFVVSKKIGNAVQRHLMTRQLRSLVHEEIPAKETVFQNVRFTYIAFEKPTEFSELQKEFRWMLAKAERIVVGP